MKRVIGDGRLVRWSDLRIGGIAAQHRDDGGGRSRQVAVDHAAAFVGDLHRLGGGEIV